LNMPRVFVEKIPIQLLKRIRHGDWYRHGIYRDNIIFSSLQMEGLGAQYFRREGLNHGLANLIRINEQAYIRGSEFTGLCNLMLHKIESSHSYLSRYINTYRLDNADVISFAQQTRRLPINKYSNTELACVFALFAKKTLMLMHWLWSMEFLNCGLDKHLMSVFVRWRPAWSMEQIRELLNDVSYLERELPFQMERREILDYGASLLDNEKKLTAMHKRYSWLNLNTWDGRPFTSQQYTNRIRKLLEDKIVHAHDRKTNLASLKKAKLIISSIHNRSLRKLLHTVRDLIYLKTERIDIFSRSWGLCLPLVDEIAKRLEITYEELLSLTFREVSSYLKIGKCIKRHEIHRRKKYASVLIGGQIQYFCASAVTAIEKAVLDNQKSVMPSAVKGTVGYGGIVRGLARIVLTDRNLGKVRRGDILVANLTNPNYNPVFKKIFGVVTDEGGILCHSAIMAREFHIPCIIGTKIATQVFKDGDLVEVDANKGVVRKLKK